MTAIAILLIGLMLAGVAAALLVMVRARREQARERWLANRKTVLLKILVPKNNEKTPAAAENLFAALHGIYRPDVAFNEYVSLEMAVHEKAIEFFVQCPIDLRDFVEGQIYAQYPNVEMHEVVDYARADLTGYKVAGTELSFNKSDVFPIKTFQSFEVDPLAGITGVLSKVGENEQIWIQVLSRPISDSWQNKAISYVTAAKNGSLPGGGLFTTVIKGFVDFFRPSNPEAKPEGPPKLPASQEQALKAVEEKSTKLGYATKIRIVVVATDAATANAKLNTIAGVYKQFNTINTNGFQAGKPVTDGKIVEAYRLRSFLDEGLILNIEELASVFHLPNVSVETPNIVWAGAKKGEPPASLPFEGTVPPDELTLFGMTDFRGAKQRFGIKVRDRNLHMYAIGKSGTGKSTMLENMAIDDIRKGRGVAIVDPHGDFVNHVLDFIPASRVNDVIYFNPADKDNPIGFNLLENVDPDLKNVVASGVVGIFQKIFGEKSWGPRLEYILRNVVLALLEYPDSTMLSVMRLLVDKPFRTRVMEKVKDPVIRDFFINEYEKYDPKFRTEAIAPIQNKVGQFLSASTIRNIVGQPKSTFDTEEAMNSKKILLFDLSIGKIGEDAAALLGSMMITKIQLAAMRRANIEKREDRVNFYLYVDEFQNFATDSFAVILSEARKYGLNLILTHQYIGQLPEQVAKAIFGNVGTLVSFRVGSSDAVALVKEFEPVFEANDMVNLDNHHIYVKMSIDGVTRPAFSAVTLPPAADANNNKEKIIHVSRERYSRPREFVEKRIAEASAEAAAGMALTRDEEGKPSVKAPQIVTTVLEGKEFEGRQDREGRHWYTLLGDAPAANDGGGETNEPEELEEPFVQSKADQPVVADAQLQISGPPVTIMPVTQTAPAGEAKPQMTSVPKVTASTPKPPETIVNTRQQKETKPQQSDRSKSNTQPVPTSQRQNDKKRSQNQPIQQVQKPRGQGSGDRRTNNNHVQLSPPQKDSHKQLQPNQPKKVVQSAQKLVAALPKSKGDDAQNHTLPPTREPALELLPDRELKQELSSPPAPPLLSAAQPAPVASPTQTAPQTGQFQPLQPGETIIFRD